MTLRDEYVRVLLNHQAVNPVRLPVEQANGVGVARCEQGAAVLQSDVDTPDQSSRSRRGRRL